MSVPRARGFTLLEVLAAIALLALAFAISLAALGGAARNASRAAALDTAVERAQTLLTQQGLGAPLRDATLSGRYADGMTWQLKVRKIARPQAVGAVRAVPLAQGGNGMMLAQAGAVSLYRLDVAVHYGAGRTLRLATERAQAAPSDRNRE